ncbi:heme oxygenase (biliverdin-producing) [Agromyces seonyuensis]|uniref:Biliverdin-producing heme oxygenase n=1 Tax=Agromyces seonyuensis TaxID=2662446 RepID=A0A6I4NXT2_9MICO|nr:biliverdin-producing heme oxygenase [Agromyces seonyuensis]MWB99058.1 biliverdin-producing heme oxygenase [Agromyces seonyuensis]
MTIAPPAASATEPLDVAALVRAASADVHKDAENRGFIVDLMGGKLTLDAYTRYLAQFGWIYEALESRGARDGDPEVFDPGLARLASIESDLAALGAPDWRETDPMLPATRAYVEHLHEVAADDVRYLAHHYTRYLGDLSGGQAIAKLVARHYGATEEQLSFYRFDIAADGVVKYKRAYREAMNDLALEPEQVDRLVAEVLESFRYNADVFEGLAAA